MYFMIKGENVLINLWKFWGKVSNLIKNKFNSELIYNRKHQKGKIKL